MSKVWLVTGSASGLGRSIAEAVLASGDRLVATARDPHRLEDLLKKYGDQVRTAPLDVADEDAAKAAVQVAVAAFGRLDVVVNNAGYGDFAPFEQLSSERFKALIDTNFYGVVNVTRAALPIMRKQKSGTILQISSVGGRITRPGNAVYHAAKWAVGVSLSPWLRKWLPLASRYARLNLAEYALTGALAPAKECLACSRIMNHPWARLQPRSRPTGATKPATPPRSLKSSCALWTATSCLPICCSAVTPSSSRPRLRRRAQPKRNAGEKSASRQTPTPPYPCLPCHSEALGSSSRFQTPYP